MSLAALGGKGEKKEGGGTDLTESLGALVQSGMT